MNLLWVHQNNLGKPYKKVFYFFVRFPLTDILQYAALLKQEKSVIKRDRKGYCNITIWMMQRPIMHTIWCILPYVYRIYVHIIWCICYGLLMISEMTPLFINKILLYDVISSSNVIESSFSWVLRVDLEFNSVWPLISSLSNWFHFKPQTHKHQKQIA